MFIYIIKYRCHIIFFIYTGVYENKESRFKYKQTFLLNKSFLIKIKHRKSLKYIGISKANIIIIYI